MTTHSPLLPSPLLPRISPRRLALAQALAIGMCAGASVTAFRLLMGALGTCRNQLGFMPGLHSWLVLPAIGFIGGAVSGHMVQLWAPEAKGSGIPYVKLVLARAGTPLRLRSAVVKLVAASIGIGAGLSLGREGPSVHIGAGVGMAVAGLDQSTRAHKRQLVAAGAGAGLAAAFNAPIAGVLFVVEEMLQEFSSLTLGSAILASVTAAVVARALGGGAFVYHLPHANFAVWQLPLYGVLGLACGLLGPLFAWTILRGLELGRAATRFVPRAWHPAVVGALTGLVGAWFPAVLGGSFDLVERSLFGSIALVALPAVFLGKLLCTSLAYGSGASGGIFSPSLVLGALVGLGIGKTFHLWLPALAGASPGFAFAGMGAFFAATARAPITATVLVFELTGDYGLILPLMLAVVVASLVAELTGQEPIYHALLRQDGVLLEPTPPLGEAGARAVHSAMSRSPEWVGEDLPLSALVERFARSRHNGFPMLDAAGKLAGMLTKDDLLDALEQGLPELTPAGEIGSRPGIRISADASLAEAWELLARDHVGRLAVVDPADPDLLVGVLTRVDLFQHVTKG